MQAWNAYLTWLQSPQAGLFGVTAAAFIAATLLPLSSEVALLAFVAWKPEQSNLAWLLATLGNTAGGWTTYALARYGQNMLSQKRNQEIHKATERYEAQFNRFGPMLTGLAWLPVVGDLLVLAAGYLRLPAWPCIVWQLLGRGLRYGAVLGAFHFIV